MQTWWEKNFAECQFNDQRLTFRSSLLESFLAQTTKSSPAY
ncbi:transposase DNA-binding-containing protein [Acaryochloris sp. IP29b_bin.148]